MTKIIFLRHGQSMGNLERRFLGHTDLPLSDAGFRQAECAADYLCDFGIRHIYSSDLLRARQTVAPLASRLGLPVTLCEDLREIYAGLWEGLRFSEIETSWADAYRTFRTDIGHACPTEGESTQDVGDRVFACVKTLAERHPDETVLISSHATAICMFACRVLGLSPSDCRRMRLPSNASYSVFDYLGDTFHLGQYGNDGYLGELRLIPPPLA